MPSRPGFAYILIHYVLSLLFPGIVPWWIINAAVRHRLGRQPAASDGAGRGHVGRQGAGGRGKRGSGRSLLEKPKVGQAVRLSAASVSNGPTIAASPRPPTHTHTPVAAHRDGPEVSAKVLVRHPEGAVAAAPAAPRLAHLAVSARCVARLACPPPRGGGGLAQGFTHLTGGYGVDGWGRCGVDGWGAWKWEGATSYRGWGKGFARPRTRTWDWVADGGGGRRRRSKEGRRAGGCERVHMGMSNTTGRH